MDIKQQRLNSALMTVTVLTGAIALAACDRKDKEAEQQTEVETPAAETQTTEMTTLPVVNCDDPMVMDRLKIALQNNLQQDMQNVVGAYADQANIDIENNKISKRASNVLIDVQNANQVQAATSEGITTCQASVSITMPSEDIYQANQVYSAANRPSIQDRLTNKIKLNNNMLVDDGFSYVVSKPNDSITARIAGNPLMLELVADVMATSLVQNSIEERQAQIAAQKARIQAERERQIRQQQAAQDNSIRQPRLVEPVRPTVPPQPTQPKPVNPVMDEQAKLEQAANNNTVVNNDVGVIEPDNNLSVPTDDSIDMVIVEDPNATY